MLTTILATIFTLTPICVDGWESLLRERQPRPVVVVVMISGNVAQRVEAVSYTHLTLPTKA